MILPQDYNDTLGQDTLLCLNGPPGMLYEVASIHDYYYKLDHNAAYQ